MDVDLQKVDRTLLEIVKPHHRANLDDIRQVASAMMHITQAIREVQEAQAVILKMLVRK